MAWDELVFRGGDDGRAASIVPWSLPAGLREPTAAGWQHVRVPPENPNWVAKLRELKTDDKLLLLRINMEAGHAGASGRFERLKRGGACLCLRPQDRRSTRRAGRIHLTTAIIRECWDKRSLGVWTGGPFLLVDHIVSEAR